MRFKKRLIPKIRFTNYHKEFPITKGIWNRWFVVKKAWAGSIIEIQVRHFQLSLDFRKNCMSDMLLSKGNTMRKGGEK